MGKISVIVPIYNKGQYLNRCIESVLKQTYTDFDLILIDDGSEDNSGEICDRFKEQDSRIIVIHQDNRGLSLARNMGIHYALTKSDSSWITFLDADDALHPKFLEIMLCEGEKNSNSIVACMLQKIHSEKDIDDAIEFPSKEIDINILYSLDGKGMNGLSACGKLFPKDIFTRIRFPAGLYNEDMYACPVFMNEASHIIFISANLYYYYMIEDSYVHKKWEPKKLEEIYAGEFVARYLKNNGYEAAHLGMLVRLLWIIKRQRTEIKDSNQKHKIHFLLYTLGKELEVQRRIRHAKKGI